MRRDQSQTRQPASGTRRHECACELESLGESEL
jgi:hypothetical protein